jgi:RNA polymerase sigma factor (sigma-70 family)
MSQDQDERIAEVMARERPRLRNFIRRRVANPGDVEDILQDVFSKLVEANRMLMPIDHVTGWLFRVARNRMVDLFRSRRADADAGVMELLPSRDAGPEAAYARRVLLDELAAALRALPREQREAFVAHEIEGRSFKEIAAATGVGVNTLLSRKRYAVLHLRRRLQQTYDALTRS